VKEKLNFDVLLSKGDTITLWVAFSIANRINYIDKWGW